MGTLEQCLKVVGFDEAHADLLRARVKLEGSDRNGVLAQARDTRSWMQDIHDQLRDKLPADVFRKVFPESKLGPPTPQAQVALDDFIKGLKELYDEGDASLAGAERNPKLEELAANVVAQFVAGGTKRWVDFKEQVRRGIGDNKLLRAAEPYLRESWDLAAEMFPKSKLDASQPFQTRLPEQDIADTVASKLDDDTNITKDEFWDAADKAYGGTRAEGKYGPSDAYDALELGVNQHLQDRTDPTVGKKQAQAQLPMLEGIVDRIPSQTNRSGEKDTHQQFSTPPAYAFTAAWLANIGDGDIVFEPNAGTGSLAVHAQNAGAKVYVNELSDRRAGLLGTLGFDGVTTHDAAHVNKSLRGKIPRPTRVLMNPPFSRSPERMGAKMVPGTDLAHVAENLAFMEDGGRLTAIVGAPLHGEETQRAKNWNRDIAAKYNILADVTLPREVYKGYGTTFPTRVLVIDKTGPTQPGTTITGEVGSLSELMDFLSEVRDENKPTEKAPQGTEEGTADEGRVPEDQRGPAEPGSEETAGSPGGETGPGDSLQSPTGDQGADDDATGGVDGGVSDGSTQGGGGIAAPGSKPGGTSSSGGGGRGGSRGGRGSKRRVAKGKGKRGGSGGSAGNEPVGEPSGTQSPTQSPAERVGIENKAREKRDAQELGENIFEPYKPSKLNIPGSKPHPSPIVESAAMAFVDMPDVTYSPVLSKDLIESGALSDIQLEAIAYAGQAHERTLPPDADTGTIFRKGFMVGDGTGVGKGRMIVGLFADNFNQGRRKGVWVTKNQELWADSQEYWSALGMPENLLINLKGLKGGEKIADKHQEGVIFMTYAQLRATDKQGNRRMDQIVEWLGDDFEGAIAFDEAHMMSGAAPGAGGGAASRRVAASEQGLAGIELQRSLPNARVTYFTATAATEVRHLAYAERLGLWGRGTEFANRSDFVSKVVDAGVAAMELVAQNLKALGRYVARSLSYDGVVTSRLEHKLTREQKQVYNEYAEAWRIVFDNVNAALGVTNASAQARNNANSRMRNTQQRFFDNVLTAMQLPSVYKRMKEELDAGKSVLIQLTKTGGAAIDRKAATIESEEDLEDWKSGARDMIMEYVQNAFPVTQYVDTVDQNGNTVRVPLVIDGVTQTNPDAVAARDALLDRLGALSDIENPLDALIDHFGHEQVAEFTSRNRRFIMMDDETGRRKRTENRRSKDYSNEADLAAFLDGRKRILIFSEAGGTGKSFHADRSYKNQQQRFHILLQAGWKANVAVQGLGRSHRTNQSSEPEFLLVHTDLHGQKRFISTIAKRLAQLGALTKGQRETGSNELFSAADNLESTEAKDSLRRFFQNVFYGVYDHIPISVVEDDMGLKIRDSNNVLLAELPKTDAFLNRLLTLPVDQQNEVFEAFDELLKARVDQAIAEGTLDQGLENLVADRVERQHTATVHVDEETGATTEYHRLRAYNKIKPITWAEERVNNPIAVVISKRGTVYAVEETNADRTDPNTGAVIRRYKLRKPDGSAPQFIDRSHMTDQHYTRLEGDEQQKAWEDAMKNVPEFRHHDVHMITGLILPIWNKLRGQSRVVRTITTDKQGLIGRVIPVTQIAAVLQSLGVSETGEKQERPNLTPKQYIAAINRGAIVHLDNGWQIYQSQVQNENRVEISGDNLGVYMNELRADGVFTERVAMKTRFFIPQGSEGERVFEAITKTRPVIEIEDDSSEQAIRATRFASGSKPGPRVTITQGGPSIPVSMTDSLDKSQLQSAHEIIATMEKLFDVPIRTGRLWSKGALGVYRTREEVVRLLGQAVADLAVASHEVAHHIDKTTGIRKGLPLDQRRELKRLDYNTKSGRTSEGFAEFMRIFFTEGREAAEAVAPNFYRYFEHSWMPAHPKIQDAIDITASMIEDWRGQGAEKRAKASVSDTGIQAQPKLPINQKIAEAVPAITDRITRDWVDKSIILKRFDEAAQGQGYQLKFGQSWTHDLMAAVNHAGLGMAVRAAREGVVSPRTGKKIGPSLMEGLAKIKDAEYEDWRVFAWARHALEVYAKTPSRNPGITLEDAKWIYNNVKNNKPETYQRFTEAAEALTEFNSNLLSMMVDVGKIGPKTAKKMRDMWTTYLPLFRARDRVGLKRFSGQLVDLPPEIRRRRGSGRQILDPVESTLQQAALFYDAALRHLVWKQMLNQADPDRGGAEGMGRWILRAPPNTKRFTLNLAEAWPKIADKLRDMGLASDLVDDPLMMDMLGEEFAKDWISIYRPDYSPVPGKNIVRTYDSNGNPELYELDPNLYEAVSGQPIPQLPAFMKIVEAGTKLLKLGAVELNPMFAMRNAIRDYQTFQQQARFAGKEGLITPATEIGMYMVSELHRLGLIEGAPDELVELWREFGGKLASRYGLDHAGKRAMRHEIMGHQQDKSLPTWIWENGIVHPIDNMRELINVSEVGPRLAEFAAALKEEGYVRRDGQLINTTTNQPERPPLHVIVKAMNAANNVTVNFGRVGRQGEVVNRYVAFFNAAVQGQAIRATTAVSATKGLKKKLSGQKLEDSERHWKRYFFTMAATAAATAVYWALRHDDDDYKEEESWLRNLYWTFTWGGKPVLRIPRSYEYNIVPSMTEAILNTVFEGETNAISDALTSELTTSMPNIHVSIVSPILEVAMNYDFFRQKPIESPRMAELEPQDRAYSYNTGLAKKVSEVLQATPFIRRLNLSPAELDHLADSISGGQYNRIYGGVERVIGGRSAFADNPILGGFAIRKDYPKSVNMFYTNLSKIRQQYKSADLKDNVSDELRDKYHTYEDYADLLGELSEASRGITDRDKKFEVDRYAVGAARTLLGEEELKRYPDPIRASASSLPPAVLEIRTRYLSRLRKRMQSGAPVRKSTESSKDYQARIEAHRSLRRRTANQLRGTPSGR